MDFWKKSDNNSYKKLKVVYRMYSTLIILNRMYSMKMLMKDNKSFMLMSRTMPQYLINNMIVLHSRIRRSITNSCNKQVRDKFFMINRQSIRNQNTFRCKNLYKNRQNRFKLLEMRAKLTKSFKKLFRFQEKIFKIKNK